MIHIHNQTQQRIVTFIGSYADPASPGIYAGSFDSQTGSITLTDQVPGLSNPTFLDIDKHNLKMYAISEGVNAAGERGGEAVAFRIGLDETRETVKLDVINKVQTVSAPTCHITLDHTSQNIIVSSYHGGMVGLLPVLEDGQIGQTVDVHQQTGSSIREVQSQSRAHSALMDRENRFAIVCDLGSDRIVLYRLDVDGHKLVPHDETKVEPGAGPRHFTFHPSLAYGYVINELNSTITSFSYDQQLGKLTEVQTVSTLPAQYSGENACADIHISPDGRFLYGSNRGHDSIVSYAIHPANGTLAYIEHVSTGGRHPRNFALSPDGRFLIVANRDSDNIVTFAVDALTGQLRATGEVLEVSKPVCIKFMSL